MRAAENYSLGISPYLNARRKVMESEVWHRVPRALRGLYLAYVNEVVKKVRDERSTPLDRIVEKWVKNGLDANLLYEIAGVLGLKRPNLS